MAGASERATDRVRVGCVVVVPLRGGASRHEFASPPTCSSPSPSPSPSTLTSPSYPACAMPACPSCVCVPNRGFNFGQRFRECRCRVRPRRTLPCSATPRMSTVGPRYITCVRRDPRNEQKRSRTTEARPCPRVAWATKSNSLERRPPSRG